MEINSVHRYLLFIVVLLKMGVCESSESKAQAAESAKIDRQLQMDQEKASKTVKLLLLGLIF